MSATAMPTFTLATPLASHATRPAASSPDSDAHEFAASLAGPNGLELLMEMAHDLRSPLTSILFLSELMQEEQNGPVTSVQRHQLRLIYSAALCLCSAASDVVEFARGGVRLGERPGEEFSTVEMFESVRLMVAPMAEEKGLDVRVVHPVPERRVGHPKTLSRVLLNLATNAVKYTEQGVVEIVGRSLGRGAVEFAVTDTGPGLDAAALNTVFQPFRTTPAGLRQQYSSAGLGLAICRRLVRAMGSELLVESRLQEGTCFRFSVEAPAA